MKYVLLTGLLSIASLNCKGPKVPEPAKPYAFSSHFLKEQPETNTYGITATMMKMRYLC
jgi:hypothetical protein